MKYYKVNYVLSGFEYAEYISEHKLNNMEERLSYSSADEYITGVEEVGKEEYLKNKEKVILIHKEEM